MGRARKPVLLATLAVLGIAGAIYRATCHHASGKENAAAEPPVRTNEDPPQAADVDRSPPREDGRTPSRSAALGAPRAAAAKGLVRLHVRDEQRKPVGGADVVVYDATLAQTSEWQAVSRHVCDDMGICRIPTDQVQLVFHASKADVGSSGTLSLTVADVEEEPYWVTLRRCVVLGGEVVNAAGTPLPRAVVSFQVSGGRSGEDRFLGRPPRSLETDARGRFRVLLDRDTFFWVTARHGGKESARARISTLLPEDQALTLRVGSQYGVAGSLVSPLGVGVVGRVLVVGAEGSRFAASKRTSADGIFDIDLPAPGAYRVIGSAEAFANARALDITIAPEGPRREILLRLLQPSTITGTVRLANGQPVVGAGVGASSESEDPMAGTLFGHGTTTTTGADGAFRLEGVHPATSHSVAVVPDQTKKRLVARRHGIQPDSTVHIVLEPGELAEAHIAGRVVASSGKPVSRFSVQLVYTPSGGKKARRPLDEIENPDGRFSVSELRIGREYELIVSALGFVTKRVGPIAILQATEHVEVCLSEAAGVMRVLVVDKHGQPVPSARVSAVSVDKGGRDVREARTDAAGQAVIEGLPVGEYELRAFVGDSSSKKVAAKVPAGQSASARLTMED